MLALKARKNSPASPTPPAGELRRYISTPGRSVRLTWLSAGMASPTSSTLSAFVRPKTRSWAASGNAANAGRSCTQRCAITKLPPPQSPASMSAAARRASPFGLAVPSTKPVRSRLSRKRKPWFSWATSASGASASRQASAAANSSSRSSPCSQTNRSCCVAGAEKPSAPATASKSAAWGGTGRPATARARRAPKATTCVTSPASAAAGRRDGRSRRLRSRQANSRKTWWLVPSRKTPA